MCGPKECVPLVVQRLRLVVSPEEFREDSRLNCEAQRVFTISGKLANLEGVIDLGEGLPDVPLQKLDRRHNSHAASGEGPEGRRASPASISFIASSRRQIWRRLLARSM